MKLKNVEVVLLIIPSALCNTRVPLAAKHPQSMMLPPPCLASSTAFLGSKALPLLLQCRFEPQWLVALVSILPTEIPSECLGLSVVKQFIFMMANRNTQLMFTIITNKKSIGLGFIKLKETAFLYQRGNSQTTISWKVALSQHGVQREIKKTEETG